MIPPCLCLDPKPEHNYCANCRGVSHVRCDCDDCYPRTRQIPPMPVGSLDLVFAFSSPKEAP